MTSSQIDVLLIATLTAVACALPGAVLMLRRLTMLSDAISHTVLLGIVLGFLWVGDVESPVVWLGAAAVGVLTVSLTAWVERTRLVHADAAVGLVFPALFSLAVILISRLAGDVHLDTDSVLVGELAFAPFNRWVVAGVDVGPRGLWQMLAVLALNGAFVLMFYKELKLTTFDAGLALTLGFAPLALHYALMVLVSVTVVAAFDVVGSILVVALMVAPPATAYLLTDRFSRLLALSAGLGALTAGGGYALASALDASIAGGMASVAGGLFGLAFLLAPERGWLAQARRQREQQRDFAQTMLLVHLFNHEHTPQANEESRLAHLREHLRWEAGRVQQVVAHASAAGLVWQDNGRLALTPTGRQRAEEHLTQ